MKMKENKRRGFTLAETLLTLAIIGIAAAMTLPSLVRQYREKAWSTAQDLFEKKLEIAMSNMNTDGTLTGYSTTESFISELKKYIEITNICTGSNITGCFPKEVLWTEGEDAVEITSSAVTYADTDDQDWAETVGVQFSNGVEALIAYNKNCTDDPYNNQFSATSACIGIIYDVSGSSNPNANGKDLLSINVSKLGSKYVYIMSDGTGITQILSPSTYGYLTYDECTAKKSELGLSYCYGGNDYYAGAAAACGGKSNLPSQSQLTQLAKDLYGTSSISSSGTTSGLTLDTTAASAFLAARGYSYFYVWSSNEYSSSVAYRRDFNSTTTYWTTNNNRSYSALAVCLGES